jgi:hypothetical protein
MGSGLNWHSKSGDLSVPVGNDLSAERERLAFKAAAGSQNRRRRCFLFENNGLRYTV